MFAADDVLYEDRITPSRLLQAEARRRLGLDPSDFVVLHRGRMAPRSGIDTALLGVALLRFQHGVEATLLIAADDCLEPGSVAGAERARLRQLARELGIEARVHFMACPGIDTGAHCDANCDAACDVLVNLPWQASYGGAGTEAAAWVRPVTGAAGGAASAASVVDGVTGWLVAPRDAQALAARLAHLARLQRSPGLARSMKAAGSKRGPA